jgi:hypothetical protein
MTIGFEAIRGPCDPGICSAAVTELKAAAAGIIVAERTRLSPLVVASHLEIACRLLDPLERGEPAALQTVALRWRTAAPEIVLMTVRDRRLIEEVIDELMPGWLGT